MDKLKSIILKANLYKEKNWLYSKMILEEGLKIFPDQKIIYVEIGDLLYERKIFKKAIEYYTYAYKIDPNDDNLLIKISNGFMAIDEKALALNYLLKIEGKNNEILYDIAYLYYEMGKFEESIKYLKDLIEDDEPEEIYFLLLAEIYYYQMDSEKALETLELAEQLFGIRASFCYLKGSIYSQKEKWSLAVLYYKKAKDLKANYHHLYRNYAIALYKIGAFDSAIFYLKKNIEDEPEDNHSYFYLIKILIEKKRFKEAKKYLKIAKTLDIDKFYLKAFEFQIKNETE